MQSILQYTCIYLQYVPLSCPGALQLSRDTPTDTGLVCDKAAVLKDTCKVHNPGNTAHN